MKNGLLLGLGLAAGAGVLWWHRAQMAGSPSAPSDAAGGEPFQGLGSAYAPADPWTGAPIDSASGLPQTPAVVALSPDGEHRFIDDNRQAAEQAASDQRASLQRIEDNTRRSNAFSAAAATAASVPFAVYGIGKYGAQLGRSLPAAARAAGGIIPPLSAPGATITQLGAVTGAGWAVGTTAGVALGLGAVKVLDAVGGLRAGENASRAIAQHTPQAGQVAAKSLLQPFASVGAVATGIVGHGSVAGNLKQAWTGTVQQRLTNGGVSAVRKAWGWLHG